MSLGDAQSSRQRIHGTGDAPNMSTTQSNTVIFVKGGSIRDLIQPAILQDTVIITFLMKNLPCQYLDDLYINTLITNSFRADTIIY